MNNHKIAFIICTNDELLLSECTYYINQLYMPDNYTIDILTIQDASSIASAYNEGMMSCDAKIKIYMHQDVFIINRNFLNDILSIFETNSKIGMIGMVGYKTISADGIMWHSTPYGNVYTRHPSVPYLSPADYSYSLKLDGFIDVALIDGFLMATSQDIPWDEKNITGWDFYDAFQSINFIKSGYRIVVPNQLFPWCLHDCGTFLSLKNYNFYRQKFLNIYRNFLGKNIEELAP